MELEIAGGNERILYVDDEKTIVNLGVRFLERAGYKVSGETNSIEALKKFESKPDSFDLVITDMAMPEMVGTEFAKRLMEIRSELPVIICTGYSQKVDKTIAKELGIKAFINKPILLKELYSKVRMVLDQPKNKT